MYKLFYLLNYAIVIQHIKQLHYYNWLYSATCFGCYLAIMRPTRRNCYIRYIH